MLKKLTYLLAAVIALQTKLQADPELGPYLGVGVGASVYDSDSLGLTAIDTDGTSFASRVFAGYRFSRHFGIEAGYHYLGELENRYRVRKLRRDIHRKSTCGMAGVDDAVTN